MKQYINFDHSSASFSIAYSLKLIYKKIEAILFIFLCVAFLIATKLESGFTNKVNDLFIDISLPISQLISYPFNKIHSLIFDFKELIIAKEKNQRLEREMAQLKSFYIRSLNIFEENRDLRKVLNFISSKSSEFKVARIIGKSHEMFNQQIFINIGQNRNIKEGNMVIGDNGMLGRISKVLPDRSSVILLNDVRSRIPVITSKARVRAILAGDNSNLLKMLYLPKNHDIQVGDMVFTSGDGDTLPPGHLAGIVDKVSGNEVLVRMVEDIKSSDIVTVVNY